MAVRYWLVPLLASFLFGCAATGPVYEPAPEPNENQALVYLYRPYSSTFGASKADFSLDGNYLVQLSKGGYTFVYVSPGQHSISHQWVGWPIGGRLTSPVVIMVNARPGQKHYVELLSWTEPDFMAMVHKFSLTEVSEERAVTKLRECRYQSTESVKP